MAAYGEKGNSLATMQNLRRKYGDVFGFYIGSEKFIIISKFELVRDLFKKDEVADRPPFEPYNETRPGHDFPGLDGCPPGIVFGKGRYWKDQRRFTLRHLRDFGFGKSSMEGLLQEELEKFCHKLHEKSGTDLDLTGMLNISILSSLWFIMTGEKLALDNTKLIEIVRLANALGRELIMSPPVSILLPDPGLAKLPILRDLSCFTLTKKAMDAVISLIRAAIGDHQQSFDSGMSRDFIDVYLKQIQDETDPTSSFYGKQGIDALTNVCIELVMAGMDTTATALHWAFFFMAKYPEIQEKAQNEIDQVTTTTPIHFQ